MMSVGILASGGLGLECIKALQTHVDLRCVFTDSRSENIINWSAVNNIPLFKGNPRSGKAGDFIKNYTIDVLLSINYLFVIEKDIIGWPQKYALNIHGSLLPKYRGRTPHVWAIINNETKTGLTVHLIDVGCDTGGIVLQKEIFINKEMTGADVLKEFEKLYPVALIEVLELIENNKVEIKFQEEKLATYYGKRRPEDGMIDWNWQKERIINWIRAQAKPYPGAFSFYKGNKIIIHRAVADGYGYHFENENGKILEVENGNVIIKTPNGAIRITDYEKDASTTLEKGGILNA